MSLFATPTRPYPAREIGPGCTVNPLTGLRSYKERECNNYSNSITRHFVDKSHHFFPSTHRTQSYCKYGSRGSYYLQIYLFSSDFNNI